LRRTIAQQLRGVLALIVAGRSNAVEQKQLLQRLAVRSGAQLDG